MAHGIMHQKHIPKRLKKPVFTTCAFNISQVTNSNVLQTTFHLRSVLIAALVILFLKISGLQPTKNLLITCNGYTYSAICTKSEPKGVFVSFLLTWNYRTDALRDVQDDPIYRQIPTNV